MTEQQRTELLRLIGSAIGIGICLAALVGWHIPASSAELGADVRLVSTPPGELQVKPAGVVLAARGLKPESDPATGEFTVRNIVGRPVTIHLRALPSSPDLDQTLRLEFTAGGATVASGTAGELRGAGGPGLVIGPGESRRVGVSASLDDGGDTEGRIVDVTLEFQVEASP